MAAKRRPVVYEDLAIGTGTIEIPTDSGGTRLGTKINPELFFPVVNVMNYGAAGNGVTDDSEAIDAAYSALGDAGGVIYFPAGTYVLAAGVSFDGADRAVTLMGQPGSVTTLVYTPTSGTALTFDYGNNLDMGHGMRDLTLTGASSSSTAVGVQFGGTNGAQGFLAENCKIQGFGTGVTMSSRTWITTFRHCMIRDCTTLLVLPAGLTEAGEQIDFDHCTFADSVSPHTNAVWIKGNSQEVTFRACSFDQAQLSIGSSTTTGAQVVADGCHFENPNLGTNYDFIVVSNNNANYLRLTNCYAYQAKPASGPAQLATLSGGKVFISGFGMYTESALTNFAVLANGVGVEIYGFNDLSGNISGDLFGGTTTGFCVNFSGANVANTTPRNFSIKVADPTGGDSFDFSGAGATALTRVNKLKSLGQIYPGADEAAIQVTAGIFGGAGAPDSAYGNNGDLYLRSDGGTLTTIYQRRSGAWVGIV